MLKLSMLLSLCIALAGAQETPTSAKATSEIRSACLWPITDDHGGLLLQEVVRLRLPDGQIPIAIAAASKEQVWVLDRATRQIHLLASKGVPQRLGTGTDTGFDLIMLGHQSLLAARSHVLLRYIEGKAKFDTVLVGDSTHGTILGAAEDNTTTWLATRGDSTTEIRALPRRPIVRLPESVLATSLPGRYRLHLLNNGRLLASRLDAPFTIFVLDRDARIVEEYWPLQSIERLDYQSVRKRSVVSLATVPLDCDRLLQILVDLRGNSRWFVIIDRAGGGVLRFRHSVQSIGFVQTIPGEALLLGFDTDLLGGGIVLYSWNWQENP